MLDRIYLKIIQKLFIKMLARIYPVFIIGSNDAGEVTDFYFGTDKESLTKFIKDAENMLIDKGEF